MTDETHKDRLELLRDCAYFANELTIRIEALADIEPSRHFVSHWQQAAKIARKIRGLARHQADEHRRKAKLKEREAM